MGNDKVAESGFRNLCTEAERERFITVEERELFERLRVKRNPYIHPRGMDRKDRIERRAMVEVIELDTILADDARLAIGSIFRLLERYPFAFYEDDEKRLEATHKTVHNSSDVSPR